MALANAPADVSLVGAVLSRRYLLGREIGRGGMGAVYAATSVAGGAPVAIKILHPFYVGEESVMTRFVEEGRMCTGLVHENILRVHECLVAEDGSPYLVMDLLEGVPLSAYTRDGGRVSLSHAIPILQGMLAGIEAAHGHGVVHRDLKPANVFLERSSGVFRVKLLDFGIAKVMEAAGGMGTKTRTGALLGTPAYMSPEQVKSAKDVDARADLWSIGVIFYEMLSGRVAFPAPTEYARLAAVLSATPIPIQSISPDLAPVAAFLERALEKDRDRRFQNAREMTVALAAIDPGVALSMSAVPSRSPFIDNPSQPTVASEASTRRRRDDAAWSIVTDLTAPPSHQELEPTRPVRRLEQGTPLTAEIMLGASSTLASPKRGSNPPVSPRTSAPPPVLMAPLSELPFVSTRNSATPPPLPPRLPPVVEPVKSSLAYGWIAAALLLGFILGFIAGRLN